jgi:hypothetical protein
MVRTLAACLCSTYVLVNETLCNEIAAWCQYLSAFLPSLSCYCEDFCTYQYDVLGTMQVTPRPCTSAQRSALP